MKSIIFFLSLLATSTCLIAQDALNMTLIGNWDVDTLPTANGREYNDIWGYVDCDGSEYAIMGSASSIHFFGLEDPANPDQIASFPGGQVTTWRDMKTYRDRAYAVSDGTSEGLMIFDLSDLPNTVTKTYHETEFFSRAHNIFVDNGRLYVMGSNTLGNGMIVLDIATDPDNPVLLASVSLPGGGYIHDVYVRNDTAYCSHGYSGFYIWDFTDPENPVALASIATNGYNHSSWVTEDGQYAIYAEEVPTGLPLGVADLTDLENGAIETIHTFKEPLLAPNHTDATPHNPFIRGNLLICSYYEDGLQIYDISDPENPVKVAYYDTHPSNNNYNGYFGNWGTYPFLPSGLILASDINNGLFILSLDSIDLAPTTYTATPEDPNLSAVDGGVFCEGSNTLLEADDAAMSFEWFQNGSLISTDQPPLEVDEAGTYELVVSNEHCSFSASPVDISMVSAPEFSGIPEGNLLQFCNGEQTVFLAPDGVDSLTWLANGLVLPDDDNFLVIEEEGNYALEVYAEGCLFSSQEVEVTFSPLPEAEVVADDGFCPGESAILEAQGTADGYLWFVNGEFLVGGESAIEVTEGGWYQLIVEDAGCQNTSDSVFVEAYPEPQPEIDTANIPFCTGFSGTLSIDGTGLVEINWQLSGSPQTFPPGESINVSQGGTYNVFVTSAEGCEGSSSIEVEEYVTVVPMITIEGNELVSTEATAYQWFYETEIIPDATDQHYFPEEEGFYAVETIDENGCVALSPEVEFILSSTGSLIREPDFTIFPNPTQGALTIQTNVPSISEVSVEVVDLNGRPVFYREDLMVSSPIDLSHITAGVYVVILKTSKGLIQKRVVKY